MLGKTVKDKITGFQGTVIGVANYIAGNPQCLIQPSVNKDGYFVESKWMDEERCEVIEEKAKAVIGFKNLEGGILRKKG